MLSLPQRILDRQTFSRNKRSKWKQIVGKKVDEKAYVSEFEQTEIYRHVMPQTCWSTNRTNHKKVLKLEEENGKLKDALRAVVLAVQDVKSKNKLESVLVRRSACNSVYACKS